MLSFKKITIVNLCVYGIVPADNWKLNRKLLVLVNTNFQPYHQCLREYRFYVNVGRGVNIGCHRCFYVMLLIISCIAFKNKVY